MQKTWYDGCTKRCCVNSNDKGGHKNFSLRLSSRTIDRMLKPMNESKAYLPRIKGRCTAWVLCLVLFLQSLMVISAHAAPQWPYDTGIEAEAGIVIDADTGAVLYGQNLHRTYAPASITKILTALVVIENCASLDDVVTFSHDAVYDVESGSGNALALEEGDQLTVRDCLHALLLRSSNQAANALAEYIARSREAFVAMMNEKVRSLGCLQEECNFANPSGLNDENQYVSPYTMAKIGQAAFANETLMEVNAATSYQIDHTINHPDGLRVEMEHKLLITTDEGSDTYYPRAVAGKTGWTSIAGNTLITCAKDGDRTLISVVLKSRQTHYSDTIALLNFGFRNFQNLDSTGAEAGFFDPEGNLTVDGKTYARSDLDIQGSRLVTVPLNATLADTQIALVTKEAMQLPYPEGAIGEIRFSYNERIVGSSYFVPKPEETAPEETLPAELEGSGDAAGDEDASPSESESMEASGQPENPAKPKINLPLDKLIFVLPVAGGIAVLAGIIVWSGKKKKERLQLEEERRQKRKKRLEEIGYTEEDFQRMLEERNRERGR